MITPTDRVRVSHGERRGQRDRPGSAVALPIRRAVVRPGCPVRRRGQVGRRLRGRADHRGAARPVPPGRAGRRADRALVVRVVGGREAGGARADRRRGGAALVAGLPARRRRGRCPRSPKATSPTCSCSPTPSRTSSTANAPDPRSCTGSWPPVATNPYRNPRGEWSAAGRGGHQLGPGPQHQLGVDPRQVGFDGAARHVLVLGDRRVR